MDADEMIGASFGSYRITSKLGQGGMGAVYLAEHPVLGRKAAVKILLPELSQQKEAVKRFFEEARTTARLRHPAMVDVYDYGTLPDGRAFLLMDFLDGECLEDRIRKLGTMAVADALGIARQIALGVSVAHGEQIVHRDLKPDNIFLLPPVPGTLEERVKILDFGIAKLARRAEGAKPGTSLTLAGVVIGTPLYMSPEQCRGDLEVDHRADVYSLGCILFSMLAGRPPFVSESMFELIALHQHAQRPTLASVGVTVEEGVERIVATMLAKAPADRFVSMLAVAEAIEKLLFGERGATSGSYRRSPSGEAVMPAERRGTPAGTPAPRADSIAPTAVTPQLRRNTPHDVTQPARGRRSSSPLIIIVGVAALIVIAFVAMRLRGGGPVVGRAPVEPAGAVLPAAPPAMEPLPPARVEASPARGELLPAPTLATPVAPPPRRVRGGKVRARPPTPSEAPAETPPAASDTAAGLDRELEEHPRKPAAPKTGQPVYRGTKLDIEKKSPY